MPSWVKKGTALGLAVSILIATIGCMGDPGTVVRVHNKMGVPVVFGVRTVSLDYSGRVTPATGYLNPLFIPSGGERRFTTLIHPERSLGTSFKYIIFALNEAREVVYQRTYSWDELNEMGWKVVIEPQSSG